jgi:hypothetical protein
MVSEASNRYTHLFLVERKYFGFNTLENTVLLLNNYEISSIYEYPVWRQAYTLKTKKNQFGGAKKHKLATNL